MTRALPDAQREALLARIPLGRLGTPDDIAQRGGVSGRPARRLHHRRDAARQRRHVHGLNKSRASPVRDRRAVDCDVAIW